MVRKIKGENKRYLDILMDSLRTEGVNPDMRISRQNPRVQGILNKDLPPPIQFNPWGLSNFQNELNPEVRKLLQKPVDKDATARQLTIEGAVKKPHGRFIRGTDHSTNVFSKAEINHGRIKKGDTLGVMTRRQRREYEAALGKHQDKQRAEVQEKGMPDKNDLAAGKYSPITREDIAREQAEDASSLTIQRQKKFEAIENAEDKLTNVLPQNLLIGQGIVDPSRGAGGGFIYEDYDPIYLPQPPIQRPNSGGTRPSRYGSDLAQRYRMKSDGVTEYWDTNDPMQGPRPPNPELDMRIRNLREKLRPIFIKNA